MQKTKTDYLDMKKSEVVENYGPTILELAGHLGELAGRGDDVGIRIVFAHVDQLFQKAVETLQEIHGTGSSLPKVLH